MPRASSSATAIWQVFPTHNCLSRLNVIQVIETLTAIDQTTATDPTKFFFFKVCLFLFYP
jgi:hypothetical protein